MIPVANPKASYLAHKQELDRIIAEVMQSGWYILGKKVKLFEEDFANYLGTSYCVGVANGTDAIQLSLRALGVNTGDEVITVSHTSVATVSAIDWIGAIPILVDIDPNTYTIDAQKVENTLRNNTNNKIKAIIPVHLYGHPADLEALMDIANRYHVDLLEDCAQAHGANVNGKKTGSFGECGAFSFYPTKNLGAFGDGGAIVTSNPKIADKLRLLQQYGWRERYISEEVGYNSRLDELQAAILDCKLIWLDEGNRRRQEIAQLYNEGLKGLPINLPIEKYGCRHVYHQYVIRCKDRDRLRKYLEGQDIQTSVLYPLPIHLQSGYRDRVMIGQGGMVVTESIVKEILCLPIFPELSTNDVKIIINSILDYIGKEF